MCNIKVYFLPEILKVYIAICHDVSLEVYDQSGINFKADKTFFDCCRNQSLFAC